jgi:hypothetical protein
MFESNSVTVSSPVTLYRVNLDEDGMFSLNKGV